MEENERHLGEFRVGKHPRGPVAPPTGSASTGESLTGSLRVRVDKEV